MLKTASSLALSLATAFLLAACAPSVPRMGNYGGPAEPINSEAPKSPNGDACDVAQPAGICWFPVSARFHPDGQRMVVNLCSNRRGAPYYCRMVEYRVDEQRWQLIAGQEDGKSYLYPAYSHDGKSMVFVVDDCAKPWCRGGRGVGQLATMQVEATAGKVASYGAVKRLPVNGATRPNFAPDDQSVVYWRGRYASRLASGRSLSSMSVYGYTPKTDTEVHLVPSLYTDKASAYFTVPLSAPHFSSDGQWLRFSAQMDNSLARGRTSLTQWMPDVQVRLSDGAFEGRRTSREKEGLGQVFAEHPKLGYLAGPGNLRLVDSKTLKTKEVFIDPGAAHVNEADFNRQGTFATAITGILSMTNGAQSAEFAYWVMKLNPKDLRYRIPAAPVLALIDLSTNQVRALEWPNVEALSR